MENLKAFGKLVKERRKAIGLSQEKLAELCGLSLRRVVGIEQGDANVSLIYLIRICIECEIDCGELERFWSSPYDDPKVLRSLNVNFTLK